MISSMDLVRNDYGWTNNEISQKQLGKLEELAEDNISILSELQDQSKKLGQLTTVQTDTDVSDQIKIEPRFFPKCSLF